MVKRSVYCTVQWIFGCQSLFEGGYCLVFLSEIDSRFVDLTFLCCGEAKRKTAASEAPDFWVNRVSEPPARYIRIPFTQLLKILYQPGHIWLDIAG